MKKTAISTAVAAAMGLVAGGVQAAAVTGLTLKDVGSNSDNGIGFFDPTPDGNIGAFRFNNKYINVNTYGGTSGFSGDVGTGTVLGGGAANATGSFTTGFIFSGAPFVPFTFGGGFVADVSNGALSVTTLDFGGNFQSGAQPWPDFPLPPDANYPVEVLWTNATANATDFNVAFRWGHDIVTADDPSGMYTSFSAQWVLEGCVSTAGNVGDACGAGTAPIPVPAAVWLFGSGLAGIAGVARRRKSRKS